MTIDSVDAVLETKNYYLLLGVPASAHLDADSLKRSYKRLALICHPDKSSHPEAEIAFKKVHRAFTVLSDKQLRNVYDTFGDSAGTSQVAEESIIEEARQMFPGMPLDTAVAIMRLMMGGGQREDWSVDKLTLLLKEFNKGEESRNSNKRVWAVTVLGCLWVVNFIIAN